MVACRARRKHRGGVRAAVCQYQAAGRPAATAASSPAPKPEPYWRPCPSCSSQYASECQRARDRKGRFAPLRDGLRPSLTVLRALAKRRAQVGTRGWSARQSNKRMMPARYATSDGTSGSGPNLRIHFGRRRGLKSPRRRYVQSQQCSSACIRYFVSADRIDCRQKSKPKSDRLLVERFQKFRNHDAALEREAFADEKTAQAATHQFHGIHPV